MINLELEKDEAEVLGLVVNTTCEQWDAQKADQLNLIADDPGFSGIEDQLSVAGSLSDMANALQRVKVKLNR